MTDTPVSTDLLAILQSQLAATQKPATGWTPAAPAPALVATGVSVPIKITTPKGSIRLYLQLPAECAASPEAIHQMLQVLDAQGLPLDCWQPREDTGGWNRGGSGGGWNGGGYRSGGGWRR